MTVRQHLRNYGVWRGTEMREAHNALGKPIDMETLIRCWDSASTFIIEDDLQSEGSYAPSDVRFTVRHCPAAEAWKAEGFDRWGHVYCDEFHQAAASAYHPDAMVVIPINMMKGDDHCSFRWALPGDAAPVANTPPSELGNKLAEYYEPTTPQQAVYSALLRTSRLIAGRYWTFARAILDRHAAPEADTCLRRGLRAWASQRGALMRATELERGSTTDPINFVRHMDLACSYVWELTELVVEPRRYEAMVEWTPLDDAWRDLDAGYLAALFWEETMPALAASYRSDMRVELPLLHWRGDAGTRLHISC
jgi:L-2-amino-thiazoline-4-carboxylic acid hydrolase